MPAKVPGAPRRPLLFALDSGFATMGAALLDRHGEIVEADTFASERAERPAKAVGSWSAQDRVRRIRLARTWLTRMRMFGEQDGEIVAFGAEANPAGQGAEACIALGAGAGLIAGLADELRLDPELVLPTAWRAPFMEGFLQLAPERGHKGEAEAATKARKLARRRNREAEDRHLYARIGALPAAGRPGGSTVDAFVLARLKTWARRPSSKTHALDAVGLGRWLLIHSPKVRAAMGLRPLDAVAVALEDNVLAGFMEHAA